MIAVNIKSSNDCEKGGRDDDVDDDNGFDVIAGDCSGKRNDG